MESSYPTPYLPPQDVLRDSFKTIIPDTSTATIQSISICTSSWKTPSLSELDAPATPTQLLLSFSIQSPNHDYDYMVAELLLSPTEITSSRSPSPSSIVDDTPQNGFRLTYERQSLRYSWKADMVVPPTRTGRILSPYRIYSEELRLDFFYHFAFSMHEYLEGREGSINFTRDEYIKGQAGRSLVGGVLGERCVMNAEEYSSAIWYRSGPTLFIHYTD